MPGAISINLGDVAFVKLTFLVVNILFRGSTLHEFTHTLLWDCMFGSILLCAKFFGSLSARLGFIWVHVDKLYYAIISLSLVHLMFI